MNKGVDNMDEIYDVMTDEELEALKENLESLSERVPFIIYKSKVKKEKKLLEKLIKHLNNGDYEKVIDFENL